MVTKVYGIDGSKKRDIELADEVFNRPVSAGSIYHAIRNELANVRLGTANTKTRNEVRGSGTKPWRQKGTGRARAGTRQSPLWVGGGVVFGPKPRNFGYRIPRKLKKLAFKSILSQKNLEDRLIVVEDFTVESGKTKELVNILKGFVPADGNRTAMIISGQDNMLKRAGRNIPGLSILSYNRLRAHELFYAGKVILFETAAEELGRFYGGARAGKEAVSRREKTARAGGKNQETPKAEAGKPAAKPATKAAGKTTTKPAGKATAKPAGKPAAKAAAKPAATPAVKPAATPAAKPATKAAGKTTTKPAGKATAKPAGKPAAKAAAKPAATPAVKPATKAAGKTITKPAGKATAKPAAKPAAKAAGASAGSTKKASRVDKSQRSKEGV